MALMVMAMVVVWRSVMVVVAVVNTHTSGRIACGEVW